MSYLPLEHNILVFTIFYANLLNDYNRILVLGGMNIKCCVKIMNIFYLFLILTH